MGYIKQNDIEYYVPTSGSCNCTPCRPACTVDVRSDIIDITSMPTILHIYQGQSFQANVTIKRTANDIKYVYLSSPQLDKFLYLDLINSTDTYSVWQINMSQKMTWGIDQGQQSFSINIALANGLTLLLYQGIMQVAPGSYDGETGIDAGNIGTGILDPLRLPDGLIQSKSQYITITRNERGQYIINMQTSPIPEAIEIQSFDNDVKIAEIGSTVININFDWVLNKIPKGLWLDDIIMNVQATGYSWKDINLTEDRTFILRASDDDETVEAQTTVMFVNGFYYGVSDETESAIDGSFIMKLFRQFTNDKKVSFQVNAEKGQYIYFACPSRFGTPRFYVGGFEGGFVMENNNVMFTNTSGYTESYQVWRSANSGLGSTFVDVR